MDYAVALMEALDQCKALVLIFSGRANESPHIRREVERAVSRGIPLIPVRIEDIEPSAALRYFVGSVHWLDALTPPLEQHFANLAATLGMLLKRDPAPGARVASGGPASDAGAVQAGTAMDAASSGASMARRLFRAQAAGIACFICGGFGLVLLVALHDTFNLLLAILGTTLFYVLVFRNLTRDLVMARTMLIVLIGLAAIYLIGEVMASLWLFAAIGSTNLIFTLWMLYEVNAMIAEKGRHTAAAR
jgi:hypothetical protein